MDGYEYIVVGSGAGGGTVAARLAEAGHTVLLLEAGGEEAPWNYQVPVFHGLATEDEELRLDHYVRHYADEARQAKDPKYQKERAAGRDGVYYPRARTLGGCTAHYAMIIIRPHDSDWRTIREATGDGSWAPEQMHQYFARVERCLYREDSAGGHGRDGWLPTRFADVFDLAGEAIQKHDLAIGKIAVEAALSHPEHLPIHVWDQPLLGRDHARAKFDPNDLRVLQRHGVGLIAVPMAIDEKGHRAGTRERIQAVRGTGRLEVRLHCHVTELVFDAVDPRKVVGVRYLPGERLYRADRDPRRFGQATGPAQEVRAGREVILSAGAYITPQLLMLSGIGPAAELGRHGIDVRVDLPGVGKNLQDRYEVGIVGQTKKPFPLLDDATFRGPPPGAGAGSQRAIGSSRSGAARARASTPPMAPSSGSSRAPASPRTTSRTFSSSACRGRSPATTPTGPSTPWPRPTTSGPGSCSKRTPASAGRSRSSPGIRSIHRRWTTSTSSATPAGPSRPTPRRTSPRCGRVSSWCTSSSRAPVSSRSIPST